MHLVVQAGLGALVFALVGAMLWRRKVGELPSRWQRVSDLVEVGVLVLMVGVVVTRTLRNAGSPVPWDFPYFYTVARNAVEGISFYDPETLVASFVEVQRVWDVPSDWLVEVGFWYAPTTVLYLAPLGFLGYPAALVTNDLVQAAFLVGSILLLHRSFPLRPGRMGLVDMALLGMLSRPVISAFALSQIVFGALFCLVVATTSVTGRRWAGGVALGVGALFKHLLIIPAVLALALRNWRMTAAALASLLATGLLAGLVFGFDVYREFLAHGPSGRSPELALDPVIQSLNGVMRQLFGAVPAGPGAWNAILYPPYLVVAAILTLSTLFICWRASREPRLLVPCFALVSLLSLIVYPNTLFNTLPLMIPALVVILHNIESLSVSPRVAVVVVAGIYGATATHSRFGFAALMIAWIFLAATLARSLMRVDPTA